MLDFSTYKRFKTFENKTILAIDFGFKVIGTAFFKPGVDPFPYMGQKIIFKSQLETIETIKQIVADESVDILVLGIPYFIDGSESETTKLIKHFGEHLKSSFKTLEFFEQDETLTTKSAKERMQNSPQFNFKIDFTQIDCLAAVIILEDFIRS
ncbi:MAG: Holliday junction resolvase RuvX [Bacteriovorax sp.]|nr:Holliday junction resolvase RuvX [Bacteriovorax sp.]